MGPAIVRARRDRRANGAPRPRVIYPLTFKVAGVAVLLGLAVMFVLFFTEKGQAFRGEHSSLKNAIEGATVLALIAVSQWQRSIIHGQLGANWSEPADLPSSNANGGRRQS
jgi:protein-S-isoprenylcysteine O-methyltransferase Ste14